MVVSYVVIILAWVKGIVNMFTQKKYAIGLDIGTASVGYAVTDLEGQLLKIKQRNMWGVRLFEEGKPARARRLFRSARRRYGRRKQRLAWLREMFAEEMEKVDPLFFRRLKKSFLWKEDRSLFNLHILFDDAKFTDKEYYQKYKHIYALRYDLITNNNKADLRLIYLALHHIVKYRGNFLYEGQAFNIGNSIETGVQNLLGSVDEYLETSLLSDDIVNEVRAILSNRKNSKKEKEEKLIAALTLNKENKDSLKNIIKAILGYQADFSKIFSLATSKKESFTKTDLTEMEIELPDDLAYSLLENMYALYSAVILGEILMGKSSISEGMIARYEKHGADLKRLKSLVKREFADEYDNLFSNKNLKGTKSNIKVGKPVLNYATYSKRYVKEVNANENLCKEIKKILETKTYLAGKDKDYDYCLQEIEQNNFLQLLNNKENGAIPYQHYGIGYQPF